MSFEQLPVIAQSTDTAKSFFSELSTRKIARSTLRLDNIESTFRKDEKPYTHKDLVTLCMQLEAQNLGVLLMDEGKPPMWIWNYDLTTVARRAAGEEIELKLLPAEGVDTEETPVPHGWSDTGPLAPKAAPAQEETPKVEPATEKDEPEIVGYKLKEGEEIVRRRIKNAKGKVRVVKYLIKKGGEEIRIAKNGQLDGRKNNPGRPTLEEPASKKKAAPKAARTTKKAAGKKTVRKASKRKSKINGIDVNGLARAIAAALKGA